VYLIFSLIDLLSSPSIASSEDPYDVVAVSKSDR
jgi:hypothetical protein